MADRCINAGKNRLKPPSKLKALILVVAYNAEKTIVNVIERIPQQLADHHDLTLLIIDDCSLDNTLGIALSHLEKGFWCS